MEKFKNRLQNDFSSIRDAIFKYFVYQTSFIKNTEYDAGNIIKALEDEKLRLTVKEELKIVKKNKLKIKPIIKKIEEKDLLSFSIHQSRKEEDNFDSIKDVFSGMFSIINKVSKDFKFAFEDNRPDYNNEDICDLFESVLKGDRRDMLRVITNTQLLAEKEENRERIMLHLKDKMLKKSKEELEVNSFYSVKEFLGRVLYT